MEHGGYVSVSHTLTHLWSPKALPSELWPNNNNSKLCCFGEVMFGERIYFQDPAKREFGEQLVAYVDELCMNVYASFKGDTVQQYSASFDYLDNALGRFDDGPFFLGQFSWVDVVYGPFIERFHIVFSEVYKNDITNGRPKLAPYIQELSKIDAYKPTKVDPKEFVEIFRIRFLGQQ
ncbi:Glutathione S-transferase L3, variant 3 [Stylosanthes scabra]|uniref:Glutathione S-transferase L3, variant 3 n=1 Tax=Stylosanthes scabra TaxID=79078 RepID=A0ABU6YI84_9FABA|nr:Glutathione S-transferase L3, variant 3 [Stylosanthes scabra]